MQVVKGNKTGTFREALQLEKKGELKAAAAIYGALHKQAPASLRVLGRLMIIHRKLKDVNAEIKYIDAAISIHESYYTARKNTDKKAIAISKKLNLLLGHTDKKGKPLFKPAELVKLELRKQRLQNKQ